MIENWKDTAFGSDFGGDFLELVEQMANEEVSIDLIFQNTDVKKYLDGRVSLKKRTDNNVNFINSKFGQYIHFEDLIIALSVMIVESSLNGKVDLTKAYGNKIVDFNFKKDEIKPVYFALKNIHNEPDDYVLFEMCQEEERKKTLKDIQEILTEFEKLLE